MKVQEIRTTDILNIEIPWVQNYRKGNRGGIDYSTWEDVTLKDCLFGVKMQSFKEANEYFRENFSKEKDREAYSKWKLSNSYMFYPGIICNKHSVAKDNVKALTGVMSIDIDVPDNPKLFQEPELLDICKRHVQELLPYVFARTKSIGHGLVYYAYVSIPGNNYDEWEKNYKKIYEYVKNDFKKYNFVVDENCSNPNRARFLAYDNSPWAKEYVTPLSLPDDFFKESEDLAQDDYDSHIQINKCTIDKFNIYEDMGYKMWYRVWRNMFFAFGYEKANKEFKAFCEALWKAKQLNESKGWSTAHDAKQMFKIAQGNDNKDSNFQWKLDVDLLRRIGYNIEENTQNDILTLNESIENGVNIIPEGKYLLDYKDKVLDFWDTHKQMLLVGSTGLGKTVLIKDISHQMKSITIVPYNDMLCVYSGEQGKVKPITQVLDSTNIKDYNPDESACVIWDQFWKIVERAKDAAIMVDECHVIGKSSNFRYSANSLYHKLKQLQDEDRKIMFITATPTFEKDMYLITNENTLLFDRQGYIRPIELCYNFIDEGVSNIVKVRKTLKKKNDNGEEVVKEIVRTVKQNKEGEWVDNKNNKYNEGEVIEVRKSIPGKANYRIIGDIISAWKSKRYDYILVWSDQYNQFISSYLRMRDIPKEYIHQIHKEESKYDLEIRDDMEKLKSTEKLEKGIYIFTQITENGFNFNNDKGKALIIIQDKLQNFAYDKIIQIIGRLRKLPYIYTKVYAEKEIHEKLSIEDKHVRAQIMANTGLELKNNSIYEKEDAKQQNEMRESYTNSHGTIENIKQDLEGYLNGGKYRVKLHDMSNDTILTKTNNKIKCKQEKIAWKILTNTPINKIKGLEENEIKEISEDEIMQKVYARRLKQEFDYLSSIYGKVNIVNFVNIIKEKAKSDKLYSTCLKEIERFVPWLDDEYRLSQNEYFKKVILDEQKFKISKQLFNYLYTDIKERNEWVEKYKNCISIEDVIKQEKESELEQLMEIKVIRSNAHSIKHKPHKQHKTKLLMLLEDGFIGDSKEMAQHIGKNLSTVTCWKQKGKIVEVKATL